MTTPDLSKYLIQQQPAQVPDLSKFVEHPEMVNDTPQGVLSTVGNMFSYIKNAVYSQNFAARIAQVVDPTGAFNSNYQYDKDTGNALVKNASKFLTQLPKSGSLEGLASSPMFAQAAGVLQHPADALTSGIAPSNVVKGVAGMITTPIEALTHTVNENGEAIPATPEQQAQNIQKVVGIALQTVVAGKMIGALAPEALAGEASVAPSKIGILGKNIGANITGQAAGGLAQGLVSGMGSDDNVSQAIGSALAFAPLGVLFGTLKTTGIKAGRFSVEGDWAKAEKARGEFLGDEVNANAQELSALKSLQTTTKSSVADVISNIDALNNSDKLVDAAVKSKLNVGQGYIVQGLSDERFAQLQEELKPSDRTHEGLYEPSEQVQKKLNMMHANIGGSRPLALDIKDPFDKAVYFARNAGQPGASKSSGLIMADLIDQTGLSKSEILSHAASIKEYISQSAKQIENNPLTPQILEVPKQNFNPQTGRTPYEFNVYKSGDNTLVTPWKLNQPTEEFFNRTGYLPNEIVSVNGVDAIIRGFQNDKAFLENVTTGTKAYVGLDDIVRKSSNLTSEMYKDGNGNQIGRAGILNRENYFNKLYDQYIGKFALDKEPEGSYADNILKFGKEVGIENKGDLEQLQKAFYTKLQDDVANGQNFTSEFEGYKRAKSNLLEWNKQFRTDLGTKLYQSMAANGMYIVPEGSGKYTIKNVQDGSTAQTVTSAEEALKFVNKSGQTNAFDLDGGDTNGVPTASGNLGALATPYVINNPVTAKWWDTKVNSGRYATAIVPIGKELAAQDAISGTTIFKQHFDAMQRGMAILKAKIQDIKAFKPLEEAFNKAAKFANDKGITDPTRLQHISDYIETMSIPDIVNKLLSRKMNPFEIARADRLANGDIESVLNYMYEVRSASDKIGSAEFRAKQAEVASKLIGKTPKYTPEVIQSGNDLFKLTLQPQDAVSPFAIIRLAQALKHPDLALDRVGYAARMKLTPDEIALGDMLDGIFKQGGSRFGINEAAKIAGYLPHTKIAVATGFNPWADGKTNTDFAASMSRMGIMSNDVLERNPLLLARNYIYAGTRTAKIIPEAWAYPEKSAPGNTKMLSFNDIIKNSEDYVNELSKNPKVAPYADVFNEHIMDVKGVPDLSDQLGRAAQKQLENLFGKSSASGGNWTKAGILLVHSAFLGGRLALTLRDVMNASTNMYGLYGSKFTLDALTSSISKNYATALMEKGIIPKQNGLDLLMPGEHISAGLDRLTKVANTTMKYNGNQLVHTQISSGIYKATFERVGDLSEKMLKNEKSKASAYDELKIDQLDPATQQQFDDLISAGKTDQAAELLGRYRVRQIVNIYGNANNPQAWNTAFGRVAGGFMSWGVNQGQTLADAVLRGSTRHRIEAGLRYGVANAAIATAGYYAGVNLSGWMINPFSLISTSPLISIATEGMKALGGLSSQNVNQRQEAEQSIMNWVPHNEKTLAHAYLPYSYMVQDWVNGINELNSGFGPAGVGKMAGMPINTSTRSPFQQDMGLYPVNQAGNALPNNNQTAIEKNLIGR